jgi:hypothetical protein
MTPSITDLRRGLALGAGNWAAFQADATDEQIRELCLTAYHWDDIFIERDAAIARARPRAIENLRKPHPDQKQIDGLSVQTLRRKA